MKLQNWIESHWYAAAPGPLNKLLCLEKLYLKQLEKRRQAYSTGKKASWRAPVPVIIVGNISVGGSGKSPVVASLARYLQRQGYQPGIISRGYGSKAKSYPFRVEQDSNPQEAGDEPLMLARQTQLPVAIDPKRPRAAQLLIEEGCDLLIADDGLQHLALQRDIELVVIDGARGLGNGHCLPVGPLREPPQRLQTVDWVLCQGELQHPLDIEPIHYHLEQTAWRRGDGLWQSALPFNPGQEVHALAGIGNPQRFFDQLTAQGLEVTPHPLPDHARMSAATLNLPGDQPIIMTAKDAVKLQPWLNQRHWIVEVEARLPEDFLKALSQKLK
ncbi:lipid-A-disaccharide kinase [Marinospirillum celere]|uniref:Tetraacyldisaccharide 4'-kinase n=1 Tax=Marinospirillum celere TaxID=1122252 RepID=A0A1I1E845_9GAMM|nr:tetraacyldisaccharide 4'-kinase [Marinospirillum celere]SFB83305.1 lipid-A-disaccharide kinase [Marinospirillum celere]